MLGALLRVGEQLRRERAIGIRIDPAAPGAGDRAGHQPVAGLLHQHLGRGADERDLRELEQHHVGARVHPPQRPVERLGRRLGGEAEVPRQDDLEDVAGEDVLLRRHHRALEVGHPGDSTSRRAVEHRPLLRQTDRAHPDIARQRPFEPVEGAFGLGRRRLALDLVGDEQQTLLGVVEGDDVVEAPEDRDRQSPGIGRPRGIRSTRRTRSKPKVPTKPPAKGTGSSGVE